MKRNLLESFDLEIKPGLIEALKRMNPDSEQTMFQHLSIVHASILSGLIHKSKKENGSKAIKNLLELGNHNGDILNQIPEIFNNEKKLSDLNKLGNSLLSFVFEDGTDAAFENIQDFLSDRYQTTEEELVMINRLVAPFSIAQLGQIVHDENSTPEQIHSLLDYNEPIVVKTHPGLAQVLGLQTLTEEPQEVKSPVPSKPDNPSSTDPGDIPANKTEASDPTKSQEPRNDREDFFNALWPWVLLLIVSGLGLYFLKKFQDKSPDTATENTFPITQNDSLDVNATNTYTLPNDEEIEVGSKGTLDSLMNYLEQNQTITDTVRFQNSIITFQDSTSTLTISANNKLTGLVTILQAHPTVNVDVVMAYDSTFYRSHGYVINERASNLSNYFNAFGLDNSRYAIHSTVSNLRETSNNRVQNSSSDQAETSNSSDTFRYQQVELKFYQQSDTTQDTTKIQ